MSEPPDQMLLRSFLADQSEDAFRRLVMRYVNLVHGSALRQVRDWSMAEDVTQAVFIVLWNKAHTLRDAAALPAWLLSVTRLAARDAIKRQTARNRHEQKAGSMNSSSPPIDFNALAANLDEALNSLSTADRSAVALRYLSARSFQEVAATLGVSEDAAKKRVSRALDRLRESLSKRGLTSPADLLENHLAELAMIPISAGMAEGIMAACHNAAAASASALGLSKAIQGVLMASKIKTAALATVAIAAALAGGIAVSVKIWDATSPSESAPPILAATEVTSIAPYTGPYALQFANGYQCKVIGICRDPRHSKVWWGPDGVPMNQSPLTEPLNFQDYDDFFAAQRPAKYQTADEYAVVYQTPSPPTELWGGGGGYGVEFAPPPLFVGGFHYQPRGFTNNLREIKMIRMFYFPTAPKTVSMKVTASVGPWEDLASFDHNLHRISGSTEIHLDHPPKAKASSATAVWLTIGDPSLISVNYQYDFVGIARNAGNSIGMFQPEQENPSAYDYGSSVDQYQVYRSPLMTGTIANIALQPNRAGPSNEVYIGGKVQRTGVYSLSHPMDLLQAVYAAALDKDVDTDKAIITLIRSNGQNSPPTITKYAMKNLMAGNPIAPQLQSRDIVQISVQP